MLRRHRVDHRPLVHRVRSAGGRRDRRHLRGRPGLPGPRQTLADSRAARSQHLPYGAHYDPDAKEGGSRRAREIRLPLQAHDHGRRADRARRLEVVPRGRRQEGSGHRRHLVADRDRRVHRGHPARPQADEAGELRPGHARHIPRHLRRGRQRAQRREQQGREHLHRKPLAGLHADYLGGPGSFHRHLLPQVQQRPPTARIGATGRT